VLRQGGNAVDVVQPGMAGGGLLWPGEVEAAWAVEEIAGIAGAPEMEMGIQDDGGFGVGGCSMKMEEDLDLDLGCYLGFGLGLGNII